ncbi:MAG: B12-binding domain-containing radical SAM protein [Rhodospirillaceae bacterium]|jgi:anaerobic magnesium-protoporphyrin IX monomethyl ester cyclase|nr:B12-binding domain-containing radical SAM protein [Rhodospirillaceae bacterium]MBT5838650.1 B12-binding domain-containing radical SAM protein [Rhodospirillaceae bacterium]
MNKFKVLFIYPNGTLMNPPPISVGLFTALLKREGVELALFDTTFYTEATSITSDDAKERFMQSTPVDDAVRRSKLKTTDMVDDFVKIIDDFKPDLIVASILEITYAPALKLLDAIGDYPAPVLAGGVLAYSAPRLILQNKHIDYVCMGEGEGLLVDICQALAAGGDVRSIANLAYLDGGQLVQNPMRPLEDISAQPVPDYSLFEPERLLRPMGGKIYRAVPVETNRGCPYKCTFCNSPYTLKMYRDNGTSGFFRKKSAAAIGRELEELVHVHDAEYVYFASDTFILFNDQEFDEFCEVYARYKLPFWIQTRAETVTEERIERLAELGCHRMSMGLEHGNEDFRSRVIHKRFDNIDMIKASEIVEQAEIPLTVNNIIGFPGETRELIFDTVHLNRNLTFDSVNASPFAPFHGTDLQTVCVKEGFIEPDHTPGSFLSDFALDQPQLSREEVLGLRKTFALYVRFPEKDWPLIERAEKDDEEGNRIYDELRARYANSYFHAGGDEEQNWEDDAKLLENRMLTVDDITRGKSATYD